MIPHIPYKRMLDYIERQMDNLLAFALKPVLSPLERNVTAAYSAIQAGKLRDNGATEGEVEEAIRGHVQDFREAYRLVQK